MDTELTKADNKKLDFELIQRVNNGEEHLYDELVIKYSAKLFQVSYGLLSNRQDAEEVVQDAFVRAFKALKTFRGDASFETWIHRIVVNLSRNKYQWNKRRGSDVNISMTMEDRSLTDDREGEEMAIPDSRMEPDKVMQEVEFENRVMTGIKNMPDKLKETMILRHVDDLPYEKIAEVLDCKVGTVKSRLARGREMLKNFLGI